MVLPQLPLLRPQHLYVRSQVPAGPKTMSRFRGTFCRGTGQKKKKANHTLTHAAPSRQAFTSQRSQGHHDGTTHMAPHLRRLVLGGSIPGPLWPWACDTLLHRLEARPRHRRGHSQKAQCGSPPATGGTLPCASPCWARAWPCRGFFRRIALACMCRTEEDARGSARVTYAGPQVFLL